MRSLLVKAALVATLALLVAAVPALAAPRGGGPNPSQACSSQGDAVFPGDPPLTHGGCTSAAASGKLTGAGYSAQCKNLADAFGGYPFTFFGDPGNPTVRNEGECVNTLRYLHTTYSGG